MAECDFTYDNSKSGLDLRELEFILYQRTEIKTEGEYDFKEDLDVKVIRNHNLINAKCPDIVNDTMELEFGRELKYCHKPTKTKKMGTDRV